MECGFWLWVADYLEHCKEQGVASEKSFFGDGFAQTLQILDIFGEDFPKNLLEK